MWCICGAFFPSKINKSNKRLSKPYRVSKKCEIDYFGDIEIEFELTLLTYKVFLCKDVRSKYFGAKIDMYGNDKNIGCPEKL